MPTGDVPPTEGGPTVPPPGFVPPPGYAPPPGYLLPPGYGSATGYQLPPGYGPATGYQTATAYGPATGYVPAPGPASYPSAPRRRRLRGVLGNVVVAWVLAGVLALAVAGLSVAWATSGSSPTHAVTPSPARPGFGGPFGGGLPGGGFGASGVVGTVASVGSGSFTVDSRSGQTVTVDEQSSTTYYSGGASASSSAVVKGDTVLVSGTRSGNTVTATRVYVLPAGGFGPGFAG